MQQANTLAALRVWFEVSSRTTNNGARFARYLVGLVLVIAPWARWGIQAGRMGAVGEPR